MTIAVCLKWINASGQPETDGTDDRFMGLSYADQAALEYALRVAENTNEDVIAVTAGPEGADAMMRDAIARGAQRAVRIDIDRSSDSPTIARSIAQVVKDCSLIWCGDYSADRGSGSVPAFIAAELSIDQALGLVEIDIPLDAQLPINALRRLDGGRREQLEIRNKAVISVEGSTARLRRASLKGSMAASKQIIEVIPANNRVADAPFTRPYRPRARTIAAPVGNSALDRVRQITDTSSAKGHGETVHLEPREAAELIVNKLREWSYQS
jgi:electron transfer flavoprotein beta subunit